MTRNARKAFFRNAAAFLHGGRATKGEGNGSRGRLPMLVRTGELRDAVTAGRATLTRNGNTIVIRWTGLPEYAVYLHEGTPTMPKRSPIELNAADKAKIVDAARRFLSASLGTAGDAPVGGAPGPMARRR